MSDCNNLRPGARHIIELLEKLEQYLKTGLTPEEVEQLKLASMGKADTEIRMFDDGRMERLSELMEADKEGRVVILPCRPGEIVYTIFCGRVIERSVGKFIVNSYTRPMIWAELDCDWCSRKTVRWDLEEGKKFFTNRAEAEKALEAMRDGRY